jgi:hypothetical protein
VKHLSKNKVEQTGWIKPNLDEYDQYQIAKKQQPSLLWSAEVELSVQ